MVYIYPNTFPVVPVISVVKVRGPIVGVLAFVLPYPPGPPFHSLFDDVHVVGRGTEGQVAAWTPEEMKAYLVREVGGPSAAATRALSVASPTDVEGRTVKEVDIHEYELSIAVLLLAVVVEMLWLLNTIVNEILA